VITNDRIDKTKYYYVVLEFLNKEENQNEYQNKVLKGKVNVELSTENVPYKEITINPMENAYLFIRTVEPNLIEYAVAKEEDDITDSEIKNCYFI